MIVVHHHAAGFGSCPLGKRRREDVDDAFPLFGFVCCDTLMPCPPFPFVHRSVRASWNARFCSVNLNQRHADARGKFMWLLCRCCSCYLCRVFLSLPPLFWNDVYPCVASFFFLFLWIGHSDSDGDTIVSPTFVTEPKEHIGVYTEKPVLTSECSLLTFFFLTIGSTKEGWLTLSPYVCFYSISQWRWCQAFQDELGESDPKVRGPVVVSRLSNNINVR